MNGGNCGNPAAVPPHFVVRSFSGGPPHCSRARMHLKDLARNRFRNLHYLNWEKKTLESLKIRGLYEFCAQG